MPTPCAEPRDDNYRDCLVGIYRLEHSIIPAIAEQLGRPVVSPDWQNLGEHWNDRPRLRTTVGRVLAGYALAAGGCVFRFYQSTDSNCRRPFFRSNYEDAYATKIRKTAVRKAATRGRPL